MARKRMISPNIWDSQSFGELSYLEKVVWFGLISLADDEGIGIADPKFIKAKLFPFADDKLRVADIVTALKNIEGRMSVTYYEVSKCKYYELKNWCRWQKIDRPSPSKFPKPILKEGIDLQTKKTVFDEHSTNTQRTLDEHYISLSKSNTSNNTVNKDEKLSDVLSKLIALIKEKDKTNLYDFYFNNHRYKDEYRYVLNVLSRAIVDTEKVTLCTKLVGKDTFTDIGKKITITDICKVVNELKTRICEENKKEYYVRGILFGMYQDNKIGLNA